jgi:hypothetical protein
MSVNITATAGHSAAATQAPKKMTTHISGMGEATTEIQPSQGCIHN